MIKLDLAKRVYEGEEYWAYGAPGELISCNSHYNQIYFAFGQVWDSGGVAGFARNGDGFMTAYDGGGNYDPDENQVYHLFGELKEDGSAVWTLLFQSKEWQFITELPELEDFDPRQVWNTAFFFFIARTEIIESPSPLVELKDSLLTDEQREEAQRREKFFFSLWGQGYQKIFQK